MFNYECAKALNATVVALNKCKGFGKITHKLGLKLFYTFVLPVIEFGSEICNYRRELGEIERVQLKVLKMLLGVKQSTATCVIFAETGTCMLGY